ncbi:amidoligase family protein [Nonomuraea sp. NEAU-A123]|uniref:amidoligase family protein n=1 Tax=Nonomuraea sp. NEAU-A123 TaxID=2839649 RepID=UPI001BE46FA3|nr:amidoligase family protein [Nonomuraea sp. NEAU-A123]MBT2226184.1 amidoligase family protein [Nonomuraea sp. NEAU-A123]
MGLDLGLVPELVRHLALPLTAGAFPEAVPDALVREAEALEALADELAAICVEDAEPVLRYLKGSEWDGAAKDAFQRVLNLLAGDGRTAPQLANLEGDALLKRVEKAIREEARRLRDHAEDMEHTQWMQYAALALLALAIARLLVWVYLYGPSVLKLIQVRTLMTRMSIQALKWRLLMNMLGFAAVMGGLDLAVQTAQLLFGNRDKLDLDSLLLSLGNGALTGLVFTGVDFGLSRLATRELVFIVSRAELGVRDQIAAMAQSVYGRALVGGVSGTVGSIPGLALSDQLDPAHLFYSFVAGTAGGIDIPLSARTHYMPMPAGELTAGPVPSGHSPSGPPPPAPPPSGHIALLGAGDTPDLVHGAEPVAGGRSTGTDLSSARHPTGPDPLSGGHPAGPEHDLTHGQGRGPGGEAAGVRTADGSEPRRVVEPTQVVLSGERPQAPGGPEQRIGPRDARPAGDDGSVQARPHEARVITGEAVRAPDAPPEGRGNPSTGTRALPGPAHEPVGVAPRAGDGTPGLAGNAQPTGQVARPALGPADGQAVHQVSGVAHGQAGVLGHVSGASNATPGHPQPLYDLPLRTPYVPPTPPPPGPDAQDGRPDQADSQQDADHRTQSPAALDQTRDPVNTAPELATHAQDVASGRTADGHGGVPAHRTDDGQGFAAGRVGDGQEGAPGRTGDRHGAGGPRTGQAQDGPVVPIGTAHEPPAPRPGARGETALGGGARDTPPGGVRETPPARTGDQRTTPPAGDRHTEPHSAAGDQRTTPPARASDAHDGAPALREGAPAGAHHADGDGTGRGRIDQLINRDGAPPPPLDPDVTSLGRRIAGRLRIEVPDEAFAHTLGTMARTLTSTMQDPNMRDMITHVHKLSRGMGMPAAFDGLVRVFDEAQRQGFDPAGATDRLDLVDRLELFRQTDPLLFPGLWLANGELVRPSFRLARAFGQMDMAIGTTNGTTREIRVNQLRSLTFDLDLGLYSLDHLGRLFLDAEARGVDVQGVAGRHDLVRELERARENDSELWDGLRIADEHVIAGLGDPAARAMSRTDRALRSVAPDGRLRDLAAEAGFSHALRTFSEMLVEVDTHGALPERPATHAELVESLTRHRERDMDGWDVRVMDERFPDASLDPAKAALLGRMDRVIVGDGAPRPPLDPLLGLSRELGLGDRVGRLVHVAERAQRLGFDPVGAPDRAALLEALRGYMDTTPDTWARLRVSDRYATRLGEPETNALARMDRIVGAQGDAPAWVLDPLRKLAGDLGLEHSVKRLAHVFRGAEERGLDPAGAADRADLVHRLNSYYRAPAEEPYRFTPTLMRLAEEALTDQLRQGAARDAAASGASTVRARDLVSDLEAEHARALEARARAWDSRPREPEVSYRWNPEAFERDLAEAFARAERGEPVVPYLTEDATGGLAAPGTGFKFGREIEYDLPESLKPHQDAINQAIARDLYDAGLTRDPWTHPYHTGHDGGYYEGDNGWRLEQDESVAGELVSPPLYDTPRTWESIQLVCEIIKSHGGVATGSTGGHIHVDTSVFDHIPAFYQRLLRLVNRNYFDTFLRLMTNPEQGHHRGLDYCKPNMLDSAGYVTLDELVSSQFERESVINVQSVEGGRTDHTEVRLPDGSLDPGVIQTQIKLALGTVGLALRLGDDQFPLNHDVKDVAGNHTEHRKRLDYSSYLELADHLYHRAADKAQLTALFAITRWNEKPKDPWWR